MSARPRPRRRTAAAATSPARSRRPGLISSLYSLLSQPAFELRSDRVQMLLRPRLETHHEHRLSVRRADESPPITEENADAVNVDDVVDGREVPSCRIHDGELAVVCTRYANLGSRNESRNIREHFVDSLARIRHDAEQPGCAIHRVVKPVEA